MINLWLRRHIPILYALTAWAARCAVRLTDWVLEAALARIGEPMGWRDVERLARERAEEEREIEEFVNNWRFRIKRPRLRLLSKP